MAQTKRERYENERDHVQKLADRGEIAQETADELLAWCDGYDPEKATSTPTDADDEANRWGDTRKPTTLRQWLRSTTSFARDLDKSLLEASTDDLNQVAQRMYEGEAITVNKPLSKSSVRSRQNCMKRFLRHIDNGADPDDLAVFDQESTAIDPEDMLSQDEFHALRNAPEHPRDRAIVDLFLYTGQRNTAIRTLRIKDVNLKEKKYRLNPNADGLKGADLIGTWNPLLGAVGAIQDWLKHHPDPDNPDAYLLTERRDSLVRDPTSTISGDTVNRVLREAAEKAAKEEPGISSKKTNAHAMRHNFVTMCKREYDMEDGVIKRLIRHKPESDVMNTTYAHLSDSDYIEAAERAFGLRDEDEEESTMTPNHCDVCREPLPPNAKACPKCGTVYTPDARDSQDKMKEQVREQKESADTLEEYKDADAIAQAIEDDPKLAARLMERLGDFAEE
ncbi:tyrosine-type recombinase/integrase [Halobacteriales archaeon Cl-PHB]